MESIVKMGNVGVAVLLLGAKVGVAVPLLGEKVGAEVGCSAVELQERATTVMPQLSQVADGGS